MEAGREPVPTAAAALRAVAPDQRPGRRATGLHRGRTWFLVLGDLVALSLAYGAAYLAAEAIAPPAVSAPAWLVALLAGLAGPIWVAIFTAYGLYDRGSRRISVSSVDEARDVFHALLAGSLGYLLLAQALRRFEDWRIYSALEAALFLLATLLMVPATRFVLRTALLPRLMRPRRALVVGGGPEARLVQQKIRSHPEYGLEVVGFIQEDAADGDVPGPVLGRCADVAEVMDEHDIDQVLLASSVAGHEEMLDLLRTVRRPDLQVTIVPRYFEIFTSHATFDDIEGMPVVTLPPMRLGRSARLLKRSFDVVAASALLVALAPVFALISLAIRLDSPGPAVYRQPRRGRGGSVFRIAKFRSMYVGAEARRGEVLHLNQVDGPLFKVKGRDPRVTRVGRLLRTTSLDELPQLWNVLRGDMSLVGPRPFVLYEADQITGWASRRLDMTPGITGLWQVLGRNDMPFAEMVKLDFLYVTNWSLWWDVRILFQTIPTVLARRGAY